MTRPMGVSVLPGDMVVLPEWLLWFMCCHNNHLVRLTLTLCVWVLVGGYVMHEIFRLFFFKSYVAYYVGPIQTGFLRG